MIMPFVKLQGNLKFIIKKLYMSSGICLDFR